MKQVKREKSTSTRGHYVTNGQLLPAVIEAKELNVVTDKLIGMIWMIAERYSRKANFVGYSFREDMVAAAVANLCNNALKFNPEKSVNPFSFYTTAIHNSFLQFLAEEKKQRTIRDELLIESGANPSYNFNSEEKHEVSDSDNSGYNPAPSSLADYPDQYQPKEIKIRFAGHQPGEVKVLKPGIDFVQDENGVITYLNGETQEIEPAVKPKAKTTRKKKAEVE